jgi:hypothetical protein
MAFAARANTPFRFHVIIAWHLSESFDPESGVWMRHQGRLLAALGKWLRRRGQPVAYAWVREWGVKYGHHTHLVLHLDPELRQDLYAFLLEAGRFTEHDSQGRAAIRITPDKAPCIRGRRALAGITRYLLKTLSPRAYQAGENVMGVLEVDDRGKAPCTIAGRRSGVSHTIGLKVRQAAGWRERTTLAELRAELPVRKPRTCAA